MKKFIIEPPLGFIIFITSFLSTLTFKDIDFYITGFIIWTFAEYVAHRFIFHGPFKSHHRLHHIYQNRYTHLPLYISISGGIIFALIFPQAISGFLTGYCLYEVMHSFHHKKVTWHKTHHENNMVYFGVTSMFWDLLLGTWD